jgi:hypothetical protein
MDLAMSRYDWSKYLTGFEWLLADPSLSWQKGAGVLSESAIPGTQAFFCDPESGPWSGQPRPLRSQN